MKSKPLTPADILLVGTIGRARGLKGHVRVRPYTDDPGRFFDLERVYLRDVDSFTPLELADAQVEGDTVVLLFQGVTDRTAAELLNGKEIYISREDAVELPPDSYFIVDLVGCRVVDDRGTFIGRVADVLQPGAADVYVLRDGPRGEVMFPSLKDLILSTDIAAKQIIVDAKRLKEVAVFER